VILGLPATWRIVMLVLPDGPVPLIFGSNLQKDNSLVVLQLIDHMSKCECVCLMVTICWVDLV